MTEKLDKQIRTVFEQDFKYDESRHATSIKEAVKMYKKRSRIAGYLTWAYLIIATGLILWSFWMFFETENTKTMLLMVIIILIIHEGTVLMKLWWWVYSSKNTTLETLKTIQYQLNEMQGANTKKTDPNN